jgi:hypothetical protein
MSVSQNESLEKYEDVGGGEKRSLCFVDELI